MTVFCEISPETYSTEYFNTVQNSLCYWLLLLARSTLAPENVHKHTPWAIKNVPLYLGS